jgi:hypothetical protein
MHSMAMPSELGVTHLSPISRIMDLASSSIFTGSCMTG